MFFHILKIDTTNKFLRDKKLLINWNDFEVLHGTIALIKIDKKNSFAINGDHELFLFNAHIAEYEFGGEDNHPTQQARKLLLKKK